MKTVRIINTRTQSVQTLTTEAVNFGELKEDIVSEIEALEDFNFRNSTCIIKTSTGRNTVSLDEELLPTGDFKLYLTPREVKQGGGIYVDVNKLKQIKDFIEGVVEDGVDLVEDIEDLLDNGVVEDDDNEGLTEDERQELEELKNIL